MNGSSGHENQVLDWLLLHKRFQVLSKLVGSNTEVPNVDRSKTCDGKDIYSCTLASSVQLGIGRIQKVQNSTGFTKNWNNTCQEVDQSLLNMVSESISNDSLVLVHSKNSVHVGQMHNKTTKGQKQDNEIGHSGFEPMYVNTGIPMSVMVNRFQCADFNQSEGQNGADFGVLPLTSQKLYQDTPTVNVPMSNVIDLRHKIRNSNFFGLQNPGPIPT